MQRLYANFTGNILQACLRVIADEDLLTNFYRDLYEDDFYIVALKKIKSTGSDFHKGGKQVLILTFDVVHTVDYGPPITHGPKREELKVVYKPSDIEVDCLIAGNSAAVNRVVPNFMAESLFEIYNKRLQTIKANDPNFTGEALTTYRFLPRHYISAYGGGAPQPIRDAYGYIQYLDNDLSGTAARVFGYYPFGASDYLIFTIQSKNAITKSFYRQEGALAALCSSFSLEDMHIQNVRVKDYLPYLIDLEISLTSIINNVGATKLLGASGGITGVSISSEDGVWLVRDADLPGKAYLDRRYPGEYYQNRLWFAVKGRQKETIAVSKRFLLQGFADGMNVLRACQQNNPSDFNDWFARLNRLNHVIVRYLAYATPDFKKVRNNVFFGGKANAVLNTKLDTALRDFRTEEYNKFVQAGNNTADPNFVSLTQAVCGPDYLNLDIPVFYHRIGTTSILDSQGNDVPIPATVTIDDPGQQPPTRQAPVTGGGGVFARNTFFAASPMQQNVEQGQVQILGGVGFAARQALLRGTITAFLGDNDENPPSEIVPIDKLRMMV